ncbi:hypothetical protein EDB82DRAFT_510935 [Fusarium venenatum]|uniref:uncharacterized protein n=1 Tax=Fusarium venenatum TaxID=56646 RepID=UPI001DEE8690|nr:hypothetical protein EDB82DRAFT_510935 [Fusarium venenatum]
MTMILARSVAAVHITFAALMTIKSITTNLIISAGTRQGSLVTFHEIISRSFTHLRIFRRRVDGIWLFVDGVRNRYEVQLDVIPSVVIYCTGCNFGMIAQAPETSGSRTAADWTSRYILT